MRRVLLLVVIVVQAVVAGGHVTPARAAWTAPVPDPPTRLFHLGANPFTAGQHRGVDLAAAPGEPVRAACGGRVRFAGRVAGVGTVSVTCGRWRVSYAPITAIAVRTGHRIGPGRRLGVAGRGTRHAGLHLGVRLEGRRFGYVDPLAFFGHPRRAPPPVVPVRLPRPAPRARPVARPARAAAAVAPWTVWVGLALLMTGLAGAGTVRLSSRQTGGAACRASSTSSSSPTTRSRP